MCLYYSQIESQQITIWYLSKQDISRWTWIMCHYDPQVGREFNAQLIHNTMMKQSILMFPNTRGQVNE